MKAHKKIKHPEQEREYAIKLLTEVGYFKTKQGLARVSKFLAIPRSTLKTWAEKTDPFKAEKAEQDKLLGESYHIIKNLAFPPNISKPAHVKTHSYVNPAETSGNALNAEAKYSLLLERDKKLDDQIVFWAKHQSGLSDSIAHYNGENIKLAERQEELLSAIYILACLIAILGAILI